MNQDAWGHENSSTQLSCECVRVEWRADLEAGTETIFCGQTSPIGTSLTHDLTHWDKVGTKFFFGRKVDVTMCGGGVCRCELGCVRVMAIRVVVGSIRVKMCAKRT